MGAIFFFFVTALRDSELSVLIQTSNMALDFKIVSFENQMNPDRDVEPDLQTTLGSVLASSV